MNKIINQFYFFLKCNRYILLLLGVATGFLHGDKLFSTNNGIDTEKIIFENEGLYESWLGIGRQGLVLIKLVLGQLDYNPYFAGMLALIFLVSGITAFGFLFESVWGKQHKSMLFLFGAIVIAHPILTEQLYFTLQGAEVTLAFNMCAVSLYCAHRFSARGMDINVKLQSKKPGIKSWVWFMGAILFLIPVLGVYQAFAPFYLFGIVALECLRCVSIERAVERQVKREFLYLLKLFSVFLTGFIINQGITMLFFSGSNYLEKQIQWNFADIGAGIRRILSHVRDVVFGNGVFYFGTFFLLAVGLFVLTVWHGRRKVRAGKWTNALYGWSVALLFGLFASPFFLTIIMGERPVIRGQLVLPFTTGFMTYLSGIMLVDKIEKSKKSEVKDLKKVHGRADSILIRVLKAYIVAISFLTMWQETDVTCRLYYTDAVRYQEDLLLAGNLEQDIAKFTGSCDYRGTVVFVGQQKARGNCASIKGDVMGQSLFAWDTEVEPVNFWSSSRIIGFMHCMGTNYQAPTKEQTALATSFAEGMNCYPAEGSIRLCRDMVVVKLSGETE